MANVAFDRRQDFLTVQIFCLGGGVSEVPHVDAVAVGVCYVHPSVGRDVDSVWEKQFAVGLIRSDEQTSSRGAFLDEENAVRVCVDLKQNQDFGRRKIRILMRKCRFRGFR